MSGCGCNPLVPDSGGGGGATLLPFVGLAGSVRTGDTLASAVGSIVLSPNEITPNPYRVYFVAVLLNEAAGSVELRLYNVEDGEFVTDSLLTSTSLVPQIARSPQLQVGTLPGQIRPTERTYEVQMRIGSGVTGVCRLAELLMLIP